jgi:hypothetical protein
MTVSRCLHEAQRIAALPMDQWAPEAKQLPEQCGNDDCTTGNCRAVCQDWLRMQFRIRQGLARAKQAQKAEQFAQKGKRK